MDMKELDISAPLASQPSKAPTPILVLMIPGALITLSVSTADPGEELERGSQNQSKGSVWGSPAVGSTHTLEGSSDLNQSPQAITPRL